MSGVVGVQHRGQRGRPCDENDYGDRDAQNPASPGRGNRAARDELGVRHGDIPLLELAT